MLRLWLMELILNFDFVMVLKLECKIVVIFVMLFFLSVYVVIVFMLLDLKMRIFVLWFLIGIKFIL